MTVRSTVLGTGLTAGAVPVSLFTCPAGFTAVVKGIGGGTEGALGPGQEGTAFLHYQASGGPIIPVYSLFSFGSSTNPSPLATQGPAPACFLTALPGDQFLASDDGVTAWRLVLFGALLDGVAP